MTGLQLKKLQKISMFILILESFNFISTFDFYLNKFYALSWTLNIADQETKILNQFIKDCRIQNLQQIFMYQTGRQLK